MDWKNWKTVMPWHLHSHDCHYNLIPIIYDDSLSLYENVCKAFRMINDLNLNLETVKQNLIALEQELKDIVADEVAKQIEPVRAELVRMITDLQTKLEGEITTQIGALKSELEGRLDSMDTTIANLTSEVMSLSGELAGLEADVKTMLDTIGTINDSIGTINNSISSIRGDITSLQGSVSLLTTSVTNLETNITSLQRSITTLTGAVTSIEGDLAALQTTVTNNTNDIANIKNLLAAFSLPKIIGESTASTIEGTNTLTLTTISAKDLDDKVDYLDIFVRYQIRYQSTGTYAIKRIRWLNPFNVSNGGYAGRSGGIENIKEFIYVPIGNSREVGLIPHAIKMSVAITFTTLITRVEIENFSTENAYVETYGEIDIERPGTQFIERAGIDTQTALPTIVKIVAYGRQQ